MIFRIRIILDSKEDVIRDIEILANNTFEDLHKAIINCFDFKGNEMASFYLSDDNWKQLNCFFLHYLQLLSSLILVNKFHLLSFTPFSKAYFFS